MTYSEYLPSSILGHFLAVQSFATEILAVFDVLLISACFFGKEVRFRKRMLIFPALFFLYGLGINTIQFVSDIVLITSHGNEIVPEFRELGDFAIMFQVGLQFTMAFFTCLFAQTEHKLRRGFFGLISYLILELYLQSIITISIAFFSENTMKAFANLTGEAEMYEPENILYRLLNFALTLIIFLTLYFGLYRKNKIIYVSLIYRILFVVWLALIFIISLYPAKYIRDDAEWLPVLKVRWGILLPILGVAFPIGILMLVTRHLAMEKTIIQEDYISSELEYIVQYKKSQEQTRAFRHDIMNNLSMLAMMMEDGKDGEAKEYLRELLGEVHGLSQKYVTGDEMLDCLVGMKATRMEERGITFSIDGIAEGGLPLKPVDICTIFANALDNAIEACEQIPEGKDRKILLEIRNAGQFVHIKLSNTFEVKKETPDLKQLFDSTIRRTSKKDKNLHGYGSQNIKMTVEKSGGMLKHEITSDTFVLSIMLPKQ